MRDQDDTSQSPIHRVAPAVLLIMVCVWAIVVIGDMILTEYSPPPYIHGVIPGAMAILGAVYGIRKNGRRTGRE